jgi:hypothetical protein
MNQTRLNKLLFMAIYQLNLEDVTTLLEEGAEIDSNFVFIKNY